MNLPIQIRIDADRQLSGHLSMIVSAAVLAGVVALAILAFDAMTGARFNNLLSSMTIWIVIAIGFQVFAGSTGTISFGHPAFVALGAYTAGILALPTSMRSVALPDLPGWLAAIELGLWPATLAGGLAAALFAMIIGPIVMRLIGIAAGIMTFGILVIVNEVIRGANSLTRGSETFFGLQRLTSLEDLLVVMVLVTVLAMGYKFSRFGLRARAVSIDPIAAETAGINIVAARLWAFVLSAFICGIGGALTAFFLTAFGTQSFYIGMVLPMLMIVVVGGMNSIAGAVTGAILLTTWEYFMRQLETGGLGISLPAGLSQMTLGIALVLVLYFRRQGLWGSGEVLLSKRRLNNGDAE